jgi:hypothetical protein
LEGWLKQFKASILNTSANEMLNNKHRGERSQTARVEMEHPTYLHTLYCHATSILGDITTFADLAGQMNLLSAVDERLAMNLNKWSLLRWFKKWPLHKEEHEASQIQHAPWICTLIDQVQLFATLMRNGFISSLAAKTQNTCHELILKQKGQTESGLEGLLTGVIQ